MFDTQQIPKGKLNMQGLKVTLNPKNPKPILVCTPKDAGLHNHKMRHSCEISYLPTPTAFGPCIDDYHLIQFIAGLVVKEWMSPTFVLEHGDSPNFA
jgi:hypothetical protein